MRRAGGTNSSVVIAGLKELDSILRHKVNQPMLLGKAPRPRSSSQILQRLRLPDSRERIAKDRFDKIESTKRHLPVVGNPEAKVFPKFRMEHRGAHRRPIRLRRARAHGAVFREVRPSASGPELWQALAEAVRHSLVIAKDAQFRSVRAVRRRQSTPRHHLR